MTLFRLEEYLLEQTTLTTELLRREGREADELVYHGGRLEALEDVLEKLMELKEDEGEGEGEEDV